MQQFIDTVEPAFMDMQSISLLQSLIFRVESIPSSIAPMFGLIEGEQKQAWKRAHLLSVLGNHTALSCHLSERLEQANGQANT